MNASDDKEVDHSKTGNRGKLDNRKNNLRICTKSQNQKNHGLHKNNKSGYRGVYWDKDCKKWGAQIGDKGKQKRLGFFSTPEEASEAYEKAAKILHKEFYREP